MADSQQEWLSSLPPAVRAEAAAEIALYDSEEMWELEEVDVDDDWEPSGRYGLTVEFSSEEINTLTRAFGTSVEMFEIMHDALIKRAQAMLAERGESDSVAAAD